MKQETIDLSSLQELSFDEMQSIDGGDWIRSFRAAVHRAWCSLVNEFNNASVPSGMGTMYSAHS